VHIRSNIAAIQDDLGASTAMFWSKDRWEVYANGRPPSQGEQDNSFCAAKAHPAGVEQMNGRSVEADMAAIRLL